MELKWGEQEKKGERGNFDIHLHELQSMFIHMLSLNQSLLTSRHSRGYMTNYCLYEIV